MILHQRCEAPAVLCGLVFNEQGFEKRSGFFALVARMRQVIDLSEIIVAGFADLLGSALHYAQQHQRVVLHPAFYICIMFAVELDLAIATLECCGGADIRQVKRYPDFNQIGFFVLVPVEARFHLLGRLLLHPVAKGLVAEPVVKQNAQEQYDRNFFQADQDKKIPDTVKRAPQILSGTGSPDCSGTGQLRIQPAFPG